VLLISPWNFPISLVTRVLVGIIAAGNCCVIKPSEVSAHTAGACHFEVDLLFFSFIFYMLLVLNCSCPGPYLDEVFGP
jgi:hypothetical protein